MCIYAFISSHLDYCNSLFTCLSKTSLNFLHVVKNTAAKLLNNSPKRSHVTQILMFLSWLPIKSRIQFKILVITFRAWQGQAPASITEPLQPYNISRNLKSSNQGLLVFPRSRLKTKGDFCGCSS